MPLFAFKWFSCSPNTQNHGRLHVSKCPEIKYNYWRKRYALQKIFEDILMHYSRQSRVFLIRKLNLGFFNECINSTGNDVPLVMVLLQLYKWMAMISIMMLIISIER